MDNLNFSEPININVRDARNSAMLDYSVTSGLLHFYYLTTVLDEETGHWKEEEIEGEKYPILRIAKVDYKIDADRDYSTISEKEEPQEEEYLVKEPKTEENPNPNFLNIYSFNVKNFVASPDQLTKAYAFINVRGQDQPIFRYDESLDKTLMAIQVNKAGELS